MIWEAALAGERHLIIRCLPRRRMQAHMNTKRNGARHVADVATWPEDDGFQYRLFVQGRHDSVIERISAVNYEARTQVLHYYRVRIHCSYHTSDGIKNGIFYFNPEMDTLENANPCYSISPAEHFVEFVTQLRRRDPKGVGLLNYAVAVCGCEQEPASETWRLLALRFQRVMFVSSWFRAYGAEEIPSYHASRLMSAQVSRFDRLPKDPRHELDLTRVGFRGGDPRMRVQEWFKGIERLRTVRMRPGVTYSWVIRVLFCTAKAAEPIKDRNSANDIMEREAERLRNGAPARRLNIGNEGILESQAEMYNGPQPAVGFWNLPIYAMGGLNEHIERPNWMRFKDISTFEPELCLYHLE